MNARRHVIGRARTLLLFAGMTLCGGFILAASPSASAATTAMFGNGVLTATGDAAANSIVISRDAAGNILVNGGSPQWGYTLGGLTRVWRTGVGIDSRGNLIYVVADGQTVITPSEDSPARRRGAGDGVRHQPCIRHTLITYTHHHGLVPNDGRAPTESLRYPLPRPRRPRLLCRVPTPARSGDRPLQIRDPAALHRRRS